MHFLPFINPPGERERPTAAQSQCFDTFVAKFAAVDDELHVIQTKVTIRHVVTSFHDRSEGIRSGLFYF